MSSTAGIIGGIRGLHPTPPTWHTQIALKWLQQPHNSEVYNLPLMIFMLEAFLESNDTYNTPISGGCTGQFEPLGVCLGKPVEHCTFVELEEIHTCTRLRRQATPPGHHSHLQHWGLTSLPRGLWLRPCVRTRRRTRRVSISCVRGLLKIIQ